MHGMKGNQYKITLSVEYTLPPKIWNMKKAQRKYSYFTFWSTEKGLTSSTNKYYDFNATLTCGVWTKKWNLQRPKLKINNRMSGNVLLLILRLKFLTTSRTFIVMVWIHDIFANDRYWYHSKFATSRRIIISDWKQNDRNAWRKVQYPVIWYPNEGLLHWIKSCDPVSLNSSRHDFYKWSRFSI